VNCPSCRHGLPAGPNDRCPFCGARLSGPMDGALAAEPAFVTPQPPLRELPGARKRERTWKDEVRERVRDRREHRSELPLFRDVADEAPADEAAAAPATPEAAVEERSELDALLYDPDPTVPVPDRLPPALELDDDDGPGSGPSELGSVDDDDPAADDDLASRLVLNQRLAAEEAEADARPLEEAPPVERAALPMERLLAAVIDLAVLAGIWAAVVYFAAKVAHVPLSGLRPAWPWLAGYLAALGLMYAGYFTGTTGQTLGKMVHRLHVLDLAGGPPGHARAAARALVGTLGVLLAGGGLLPMLYDPARRALHDRLLKTRVIRL
jgi:uncharacterized RDD family membrane protein YckC